MIYQSRANSSQLLVVIAACLTQSTVIVPSVLCQYQEGLLTRQMMQAGLHSRPSWPGAGMLQM